MDELFNSRKITISVGDYIELLINSYNQPALAMDKASKIITCNNMFLNIYRLDSNDLINRSYFDYFKQSELALPADSLKQLINSNPNNITTHRVLKKGSIKYFQWTAFVCKFDFKKDIVILLGHDVTSILESAIKEQLLLDSLIDYIPSQIFWKNKELEYLGCNKAFVESLGLHNKKDVIGRTDFDLPVDKRDSSMFREDDLRIMRSVSSILNIEEVQTLENGVERILSTSKVPLFNDQGDVYGVLGIYRDITEQKRVENELKIARNLAEQANLIKSEFIANMSHDIRTPLSGVVGMSQLLVDMLCDKEQKQHALWIHECSLQLLGLLNDILSVAASDKVTRGQDEDNIEVFSLSQCINDLISLERPSTSMKGIDLIVAIDNSIPDLLVGDRPRFYRVLLNLLGNAIKFTSNGSVTLQITKEFRNFKQVKMIIKVIDTGIGISEDLQHKVFDRFYKANPSYKGIYSGHGLGLHIAKTYVSRMGGDLKCISKVGFGTTFYFDLIFGIAATDRISIVNDIKMVDDSVSNHTQVVDNSKITILLVEDNVVALKVLESIAKILQLRFVSVKDGEAAYLAATTENFQLMITDIGLPGISGEELTIKIRDWERRNLKEPMPIIGLTAHVSEEVRKKCILSGMNEVYSKPIDVGVMNELIDRFT